MLRNNYIKFIYAFILPFFGLVYSIKNYRNSISKYLFLLFCAYYGSILIFNRGDADISYYAEMFSNAHSYKGITFTEYFKTLGSHDNLDLFNPLLSFILSRITSNVHFYFMVVGLVFGLFYSNNLWDVISGCKQRFYLLTATLIFVFALLCSFDTMGTVRMHTGFQVFFFGIFQYLTTGTKKRLIWIPLSVLFHFSMFYLVIIAVVFVIINRLNLRFFFIFFLFAHFINQLDLNFVHNIFSFMPEDVNSRLMQYADAKQVARLQGTGKFYLGDSNFWARLDSMIIRTYILVQTLVLFLPRNFYLTKLPEYKTFLKFSLLLYGFSLIIANLPSGYRFMIISSMVFMSYYTVIYNNYYDSLPRSMLLSLKVSFLFLVIASVRLFRNILDFSSIMLFIGNFATSFLMESNTPVLELVKKLFGSS